MSSRFLPLLALFALLPSGTNNPQWSHDGRRAVAIWQPETASDYRFRFGFTYVSKQLQHIELVISRKELPGEPSGERSQTIVFTRDEDEDGEAYWTAPVHWQGQGLDANITYVTGRLTTKILVQPLPEGDCVMAGKLTFQDLPRTRTSEAQVIKGSFFGFHSSERLPGADSGRRP